ncbi:unnamed protein product [Closterium sp. NIES-65]|nr:unnamed protein product [Closterium sp. NIES-65]
MTWPSSYIPRSSTKLSDLPADVIYLVLKRLPPSSVRHLSACSTGWRAACSSDAVWRALYAARWGGDVADWDGADDPSRRGNADVDVDIDVDGGSVDSASAGSSPTESFLSASPPSPTAIILPRAAGSYRADSKVTKLPLPPSWRNPASELPLPPSWRQRFRQRAAAVGETAALLTSRVTSAARHDSLEVKEYQVALGLLACSRLVFADVARLLLSPQLSVLLNLLGVHHALMNLRVEPSLLLTALQASGTARRVVCVRWWVLGAWGHVGFRMRDEMLTASVQLKDFAAAAAAAAATASGDDGTGAALAAANPPPAALSVAAVAEPVPPRPEPATSRAEPVLSAATPEARRLLGVVCRGAVHEVMRVQIAADFTTSAWVARDMHSQL